MFACPSKDDGLNFPSVAVITAFSIGWLSAYPLTCSCGVNFTMLWRHYVLGFIATHDLGDVLVSHLIEDLLRNFSTVSK